jgi:hypothetical protein
MVPVDITEATVLLARLRAVASFPSRASVREIEMVQIRALIVMLTELLSPVLDQNLYGGILRTEQEKLARAGNGNAIE